MYDKPVFNSFDNIEILEIAPGFFSKLIHTASNTINFIEVKAGCTVNMHSHVHEQCAFVLEGKFEMTIATEIRVLTPSTFAIIPPNVLHGGTALTDCRLIDIFFPVREDYRLLGESTNPSC